jgi:hypothetical protein
MTSPLLKGMEGFAPESRTERHGTRTPTTREASTTLLAVASRAIAEAFCLP